MAHTAPKPHGQRSKGGLKGKGFLHICGLNRVVPSLYYKELGSCPPPRGGFSERIWRESSIIHIAQDISIYSRILTRALVPLRRNVHTGPQDPPGLRRYNLNVEGYLK